MKKLALALAMAVAFASGAITMAQVHDWHDIDRVHHHVIDAMHELEHVQQANGFDMGGHAARALDALHAAEHELDAAVRYAQTH